jgi:Fe2+ transport system protein FeoA
MRHSTIVKVENDNRFHPKAPLLRLSDVPIDEWHQIETLEGPQEDCRRLLDLGFTPGEDVLVAQCAPLGEPLVVRIRGALLALRKREAAWILVR